MTWEDLQLISSHATTWTLLLQKNEPQLDIRWLISISAVNTAVLNVNWVELIAEFYINRSNWSNPLLNLKLTPIKSSKQ